MKKILSFILIGTMLMTLSACGEKGSAPTDADTGENENIGTSENNMDEDVLKALVEDFDRTASIEETILFDEKQIQIIAKDLSFSQGNVDLAISISNNTEKQLGFSCGSVSCDVNSINGIMAADGFVNCDVAAGQTLDATISFSILEMVAYGISGVADMEIGFWVSGEDYDNFYTGPLAITTSLADTYDYSQNTYQDIITSDIYEKAFGCQVKYFSDEVLYESADQTIRVVSVALIENGTGDVRAFFEIENNGPQKVQAWGKETHINGELIHSHSSWIESINSGKRLIASFALSDYAKEYTGQADLSTLNEFMFTLSTGENSQIAKDSGQVKVVVPDAQISLIAEDTSLPEEDASLAEVPATENEKETDTTEVANDMRPEFKEAMDSYEAFFDEYIAFMEEYMNSADVAGMLMDYTNYVTKYAETMEKLNAIDENELSTEEALYYTEVMGRISQKLATIGQ